MVSQQYQLVMRTGPTMGKAYRLGKNEVTIGREPTNDIVINEAEVSRKHARLVFQNEMYTLEDLGSTNGTFVNDQRLTSPQELQPGDSILLGENVSITYELPQPEAVDRLAVQPRPSEAPVAPAAVQQPAGQVERPATPAYQPAPAYSGRIPPAPVAQEAPEIPPQTEKQPGRRTWLYAGCGCLLVVVCLLAVGVIAFDQLELYCVPPFDVLGGYMPIFSWVCY
jgi:pSer/pThr/pTyr-binding forkhead associated (FHA) protein